RNVDHTGLREIGAVAMRAPGDLRETVPLCDFRGVGWQGNAERLGHLVLMRKCALRSKIHIDHRENTYRDESPDDEPQPLQKLLHDFPHTQSVDKFPSRHTTSRRASVRAK